MRGKGVAEGGGACYESKGKCAGGGKGGNVLNTVPCTSCRNVRVAVLGWEA